jgi:hypothetical protein
MQASQVSTVFLSFLFKGLTMADEVSDLYYTVRSSVLE